MISPGLVVRTSFSFSASSDLDPSAALVALLRSDPAGSAVSAMKALGTDEVRILGSVAVREGLAGVVFDKLTTWPSSDPLRVTLSPIASRLAVVESLREPELVTVLSAFAQAGVRALVFKGAQTAYTCYAQPHHRPRLDSDVLVEAADELRAFAVLEDLGYERVPQLETDRVRQQCIAVRKRDGRIVHAVDLHWGLINPQENGGALGFGELAAAAVPIPALGPTARGLGPMHALLVSLVHPVAHHRQTNLLVWDLDTARLAERLTPGDWDACVSLAIERRLAAVGFVRLERAIGLFGAPVPPRVMAALVAHSTREERDRYEVRRRRSRHLASVMADVRALPGWRERCRFIVQQLFPPASYMREIYAPSSATPLPVLYADRALRSAVKWIRRPK